MHKIFGKDPNMACKNDNLNNHKTIMLNMLVFRFKMNTDFPI